MATSVILARIAAWERAGAIDHDLADRLRALEAAESAAAATVAPAAAEAPAAAPPTVRGPSSGFIVEFFAYLGGLFVLLAWYAWFVLELPEREVDRQLSIGFAALVPALVLGAAGWILAARADARLQRAAAIALVAAAANAGVATWCLLQAARIERTGDLLAFLIGATVALTVAAAGRARRPSAITQAGLLAAWGVFGIGLSAWAQHVIWPTAARDEWTIGGDPGEQVVMNLAQLAWWWLVAAIPAAIMIRWPDRGPGHEGRDTVTRAGIGTIAVLGTTSALLASYAGEQVFAPWLAAGVLIGVGAVFVAAARWSGSRVHLVSAGAAIVIGLTYLNMEYVAGPAGAATALLVEGGILLGVAALGWAAGRGITRRRRSPMA